MLFKIHITTNDGTLLNTIIVDTEESFWDAHQEEVLMGIEIFEEIKKAQEEA